MFRVDDLSPADAFRALWPYKWVTLALALVGGALVYGYSLFLPDMYAATTLVLVEDPGVPQGYVRSTVTVSMASRLRTLEEQILSRTALEEIMLRFDLYADGAAAGPWESRLDAMRKHVVTEVSREDGFRVSFTHENPVTAMEVTNALADLFIQQNTAAKDRQVEDTTDLLGAQVEETRRELDRREHEIADLKTANMGKLPEQLQSNLGAVERLQTQLSANFSALTAARRDQSRLRNLVSMEGAIVTEISARERARQVLSTGAGEDLEQRLASEPTIVRLEAVKLQREALLSQLTSKHPDVRLLEMTIAALQQRVLSGEKEIDLPVSVASGDSSAATGTGETLAQQVAAADLHVRILTRERDDLESQVALYEARIMESPGVEQTLNELQRGYDSLSKIYVDLLDRSMEAKLASDLERRNPSSWFRVVDPAIVPEMPASPYRVLYLAGGLIAGLGLGALGGLCRELLLQPMNSADEVERFAGIPVLSAIPEIDNPAARRRRISRLFVSSTAVVVVLLGVLALRLIMRPM